jgi:hypothetical protein
MRLQVFTALKVHGVVFYEMIPLSRVGGFTVSGEGTNSISRIEGDENEGSLFLRSFLDCLMP